MKKKTNEAPRTEVSTPTPWRVTENGSITGNDGHYVIRAATKAAVAQMENAELIVRAVNNFQEMLEMLEAIYAEGVDIHYYDLRELIERVSGKRKGDDLGLKAEGRK